MSKKQAVALAEARESADRVAAKGRVLVADDDAGIRSACCEGLRAGGYEATGVPDGLAASELLRSGDYDVILSDISMPGLDGLGLLRAARAHSLDVPVVLMTGEPQLDTAVKALELGALRYLRKPFHLPELLEVVGQAVRLHRLAKLKREALATLGSSMYQVGDKAGLEASFTRALETLRMAYQPIVDFKARRVYGWEALVRCQEPSIPHPGALLSAAERLERLTDLGRRIRATVASDIARVQASEHAVFVNLHSRDLLDDELYSASAPLSQVAERIILEITERAALDGVGDARSRVSELRALGYRVAIDDLGAGYAGLTSFATLEPEIVKLDISLVRDVNSTPLKQRLIRSISSLCVDMGQLVVAEGIETASERDAVLDLGCDLLQGYLFAKPGFDFPAPSW